MHCISRSVMKYVKHYLKQSVMASMFSAHRSQRDNPVDVQTLELIYTQCVSEIKEIIFEYSDIDEYLEEYTDVLSHLIKEIRRIKNVHDSASQRYYNKLDIFCEFSKQRSLRSEYYEISDWLLTLRQALCDELKQHDNNRISMFNHTSFSGLVSQKSVPGILNVSRENKYDDTIDEPLKAAKYQLAVASIDSESHQSDNKPIVLRQISNEVDASVLMPKQTCRIQMTKVNRFAAFNLKHNLD